MLKNKFIIMLIFFSFFAFFNVKSNDSVKAISKSECSSGDSITVNATLSDEAGGNITISETCKSGLIFNKKNITVTVELNEGYIFNGWYNSSDVLQNVNAIYTFTSRSDVTLIGKVEKVNAVVRGESSNYLFETLDDALASGVTPLYLLKNVTITQSITIPSGVNLVLPFANGVLKETQEGSNTSHDVRAPWANGSTELLYLTLTIDEGVTLTINGQLTVGAVQYNPNHSSQGQTAGVYSQIVNNGNIVVNGVLKVRGLVKGTLYRNNETVGVITINSGATLYQPFLINDFAGGDNTSAYYNAGLSPFSQYATINIQCKRIIEYGAMVKGLAALYTLGSIHTQEGNIIYPINGESAMIKMHEGSRIVINYNSKSIDSKVGNIHLGDSGVNVITVYGEITGGEFKIALDQLFFDMEISTIGRYMSIPYTYNFVFEEGSTFNIGANYMFKIMPGAIVKMKKGSTANINGALLVYDSFFQTAKSGKMYPGAEFLTADGKFDASGMFILDGTLNINGTFAGIVQSRENALINVGENAVLSVDVVEGSSDGDENALDNIVNFTLTARVYGLGDFIQLENNKKYKYFSADTFVLKDFYVDKANNFSCVNSIYMCEDSGAVTVNINQQMEGRMLEWDNDLDKFVTNVDYYVGEKVSLIGITVDDSFYVTDSNGTFSVLHTFSKGELIYYYTTDKEVNNINHSFVLNVYEDYFLLDEVIKSVVLSSSFQYKKIEDEGTFGLSICVSYYGGTNSSIVIEDPELIGTNYVHTDKEVNHDMYFIDNNIQTFTVIPRKFVAYNDDVDNFVNTLILNDLVDQADALWQIYNSYIKEVENNNDDLEFAQTYLKDDYARKIIKKIGSLGVVTYGDMKVNVSAYRIDGEEVEIEVVTSNYSISPSLDVTFTYIGEYADKKYIHTIKPSGIGQKTISITIDNIEIAYDSDVEELTAQLVEGYSLVNNDTLKEVVFLSCEVGSNVGQYYIYLNENNLHPGYSITVTNNNQRGIYKIVKRELVLDVGNHETIRIGRIEEDIEFSMEISGEGSLNPVIVYEIRNKENELVATVKNSKVTIVDKSKYVAGTYSVYATVEDKMNYSVASSSKVGTYKVVEDKEYYDVKVSFYNGENEVQSHTYDGSKIEVRVSVSTKKYSEVDVVETINVYTVKVNGLENNEIKNVGTYVVSLKVDDVEYVNESSIVVSPKILSLSVDTTTFVYNGKAQQPAFTLSGLEEVDKELIGLEIPKKETVNVSKEEYVITVSLNNNELGNYVLPESKTQTYTIYPLPIEIEVLDHNDVMYDNRNYVVDFGYKVDKKDLFNCEVEYHLFKEGIHIATVQNGVLTVEENQIYDVGLYEVYAIVLSDNYSVVSYPCSFNIVENNKYYGVEVSFYSGEDQITEHIYDGSEIDIFVFAWVVDTGDFVTNIVVKINGLEDNKIKNVGTYIVSVVVDGVEYTNVASIVVLPKVLSLSVDTITFVYNGKAQQPMFTLSGLVEGDTSLTLNIPEKRTVNASDEGYSITVSLNNNELGNYVLPESKTQTYIIVKRELVLDVGNHETIRIGRIEEDIEFSMEISGEGSLNPVIVYEIRNKENELVATVKNSKVTIVDKSKYVAGTYSVYATVEDKMNYSVASSSKVGTYKVVEDKEYYDVKVSFYNGENEVQSHTYDGSKIEVRVSVSTKKYSEVDVVETINVYTVKVNGLENNEIKNAGTYVVSLEVDDVEYVNESSIVVSPKILSLSVDTTTFVYNGKAQQPRFSLDNVIGDDEVTVSVVLNNTVNKGNYVVVVSSLLGKDKENYELPPIISRDYVINAKSITVNVNKASSIYGNKEASLTFKCEDEIPVRDNIYNFITLSKEKGIDVGFYDIVGINSNDNYSVTFVGEDNAYEIEKRDITVSIDNIDMVYGDKEVELSAYVAVGSLGYGDTLDDIVLLEREVGNVVGSYKITGKNKSSNYNMVFASGTCKIKARELTVKVNDVEVLYGDSHKNLSLEIISGSMAYDEDLYDLINVVSDYKDQIGVYDIYASKEVNDNYEVKIVYTGPFSSIYEVIKRPIKIEAESFEVDNERSWLEIENKLKYNIVSGSIKDGDDLNITLSISLQSGITLTEENFEYSFTGGEHVIKVSAKNNNYDIDIVNGKLTVTKRVVGILGIKSEYTYQDGDEIEFFNWKENISNYGKSATNNSFGYSILKKNGDLYETVNSIIDVGEYRVTIFIVHNHAFEFEKDTVTAYDIVVNKKDITNEIEVFNIPVNGVSAYSVLGFVPGVELSSKYEYVNYNESLLYDNKSVSEVKEVGKYVYSVVIDSDSYVGIISVEFEIVKKDISNNISFGINPGDFLILPNNDVDVSVYSYTGGYSKQYFKLGEEVVIDSISEEGEYKLTVSIEDDKYKGQRSIEFKVVSSVLSKIEVLIDLCNSLYSNISVLEKKEVKNNIGLILGGFTEYDWDQISNSSEYLEVVNKAQDDYDNYKIAEDVRDKGLKNNNFNLLISSGVIVVVMIVIILVMKRKKAIF